jgi:hypothetical protein
MNLIRLLVVLTTLRVFSLSGSTSSLHIVTSMPLISFPPSFLPPLILSPMTIQIIELQ